MREEWQIGELIETMQISLDDVHKLSADSLRPLLAKENEAIRADVLKKVSSYLKNGNKLTKFKTEEFIARTQGVCKTANLPKPRIHECESPYCMMAVTDGSRFCSEKCEKEASKPTARIQQKKYHPPPDWKERMHVKVSQMEFEVINELQAEGWPIDTEYWIPLTKPDGYLHEIRLALEVDGEQVHKGKKAERDEIVNQILRRRGEEPARERFSHYSVKRKEEIKTSFRERMIEGYRKKGLPLPVKVQERMEAIQ